MQLQKFRCIRGNQAQVICINPKCQQKNPLICSKNNRCFCTTHDHKHDRQYQIQVVELIKKIHEFEMPLFPLKQKILKSFQRQQQNYLYFLRKLHQNVETKLIQLHCNLYQYNFSTRKKLDDKDFNQLTAKQIHHFYKQLQINYMNPFQEIQQSQTNYYLSTLESELSEFNQSIIKKSNQILPNVFEQSFLQLDSMISYRPNRQQQSNLDLPKLFSEKRINQLDLDNLIEPNIINAFSNMQKSNYLTILKISNNKLNDESISLILLSSFPQLKEFHASKNLITDQGALQIAHRSNWPNLKYLNLYFNKIKSKGACEIIKNYNQKLEGFDFGYNLIDDEFGQEVKKYDWNKLKSIYLDCNDMSIQVLQGLDQFFASRPKMIRQKKSILPNF